jgi:hypothetical protein
MKKVGRFTPEQFKQLLESTNKRAVFGELLGLNPCDYHVGDTVVEIPHPEPLGIYEYQRNDGKSVYYGIICKIDEKLAVAYSLYPSVKDENIKEKGTAMGWVEHTMNKIMVLKGGCPAIHKLGNIGRKQDEYIRVYAETEDEYIGVFEEGFGFADVRFNKEDCRALTKDEVEWLNKQFYAINNVVCGKVKVDNDGNITKR